MVKYLAWLMIAIGLFLKLAQVLRNRSKPTYRNGCPMAKIEAPKDKPFHAKPEHTPIIVDNGVGGMSLKCSKPGCPWTYDDPFGAGAQQSFDDHIKVKSHPPQKESNDPVYERRMISWVNSQYQEPEA